MLAFSRFRTLIPGKYEPLPCVNKLKEPSNFNKAKSTAVFAPVSAEAVSSKLRAWSPPMPGPGQYKNAGIHPMKPSVNAAVAAFKSASKRGEAGPEQGDDPGSIPGPGAYYSQKPILPPSGSGHDGVNAVFKEPSQRRFCPVHPDLPAADHKARKALGDFAGVVAKECVGDRISDLPGPGKYDQDRDSMWDGKEVGIHGMSSFLPGSRRTDWAPEEVGLMPGPGSYAPPVRHQLQVTDAKSAFVSLTEQHGFADLQKGPGPCYYKPGPPGSPKRSFLLNSKKRWL